MKAIVIKYEGKPLFIAKTEDLTEIEFLKIKKECEKNIEELKSKKEEKENANLKLFLALVDRVNFLEGVE